MKIGENVYLNEGDGEEGTRYAVRMKEFYLYVIMLYPLDVQVQVNFKSLQSPYFTKFPHTRNLSHFLK